MSARPALGAEGIGTLYMIAGGLLLTAQDAVSKWLTSDYHAGEIMAYRGIFMLLPLMGAIAWHGGAAQLRPRRPLAVGLRSVFTVLTSGFVVLSFAFLPLADALAIIFLNPLLVTALSAVLLAETVGWRRWSAVAAGFAGILLMTRPGGEGVGWVVAIPLTAALFAALRDVTTRRIGTTDTTLCLLFYPVLLTTLAGLAMLPFGTHWPSLADWILFAAAGLLGGGSMFMTTRAFQIARASTVAPFKYLSLVWAVPFGYLLWGDLPGPMQVAGAGLVVASGLYVLHRETRLARQARAA